MALLAVPAVLAGWLVWAGGDEESESPPRRLAGTADYLPGREADTFLPNGVDQAPVVVLVPGGGWRTPDRSGLSPLADSLADAGIVAVTVEYVTPDQGARFPRPVRDVACAAAFAAEQAREAGIEPGPVLLLGHSAGAHLAALGALATDRFLVGCPYPAVTVDGLVGLAGPYDVTAWAELVQPLFGVPLQGHRDRWAAGDPLAVAATADRSGFRVLLAHGDIDDLVPPYESRSFAAVLERAGATVSLEIVPGADHDTIYSAATAGPLVARWLAGLSGSAPGAGAETPAR